MNPSVNQRQPHSFQSVLCAIVAVTAVTTVISAGPVMAQGQPALPSDLSLVAAPLTTLSISSGAVNSNAADSSDSDDPFDDRGYLEIMGTSFGEIWSWTSYTMGTMFSAITPPTPAAMVKRFQDDEEKSPFFALIGYAGYKIKEIENGIGLPPDVTVKFGRIRNLSDADIDYIDRELSRWEKRDSGVVAEAQRAVISTLVSVNQSDSYVIDAVRLRVLPLPQVKFTLAPTEGGMSMENSVLLRAIQRLDRRLVDVQKRG